MDWTRFGLTVLAAGFVGSLSDWIFFGMLFHDKYMAYPEVWRRPTGSSETKPILISTAIGFATAAAFAFVCHRLYLNTFLDACKLALAVWVIGCLPIVISSALWIKLHSTVTVAHSLGWLARLLVYAAAVALIMK